MGKKTSAHHISLSDCYFNAMETCGDTHQNIQEIPWSSCLLVYAGRVENSGKVTAIQRCDKLIASLLCILKEKKKNPRQIVPWSSIYKECLRLMEIEIIFSPLSLNFKFWFSCTLHSAFSSFISLVSTVRFLSFSHAGIPQTMDELGKHSYFVSAIGAGSYRLVPWPNH